MERIFPEFSFVKIISGEINSGKSTDLYNKVIQSDKFIGFITLPIIFSDNKKGYFLHGIDIPYNGIISSPFPVLMQPPLFYWKNRFFSDKIFSEVTEYLIENPELFLSKILIIDEIGPLEKGKRGWYKLLKFIITNKITSEIVIRDSFINEFREIISPLKS